MTREDGEQRLRLEDLGPDLVLVDRRTGQEIPVRVQRRRKPASPEVIARIRKMQREIEAELDASEAAREAAAAEVASGRA